MAESNPIADTDAEARRQSLLAGAQDADRETLDFIEHAGDSRGWNWSPRDATTTRPPRSTTH